MLEMAGDESLAAPVAGSARTGPRRMDEHLAQKITELTRERYRKSLRGFIGWLDEFQLRPVGPEEFDDLAVEYKNASAGMTRPAFVLLLSALERFNHRLKRRRCWSHAVVDGGTRALPVRHTAPLGAAPSYLLAVRMAVQGCGRLAVGLLLQQRLGLRPGEMLSLQTRDVAPPVEWGGPEGATKWTLGLGVRTGTKVRRSQFALLDSGDLLSDLFGRALYAAQTSHIFPFSRSTYADRLKRAASAAGRPARSCQVLICPRCRGVRSPRRRRGGRPQRCHLRRRPGLWLQPGRARIGLRVVS